MNPTIVTIVLVTILLKQMVIGYDYCQASLCRTGKHIGCGSTDNFASTCPAERSLVPMTADLRAYLLKKHNEARCNIANGKISGYKSANRMIEMVIESSQNDMGLCLTKVKLFFYLTNTDMGR